MRLVLDTWNMAAVERALIVAALQHDAWEAASLLGVTPLFEPVGSGAFVPN